MGFFLPPPQDLERDAPILIDLTEQDTSQKRHVSLAALTCLQELDLTACGKLTDVSIAKVGTLSFYGVVFKAQVVFMAK